jgi:hypothetical protein
MQEYCHADVEGKGETQRQVDVEIEVDKQIYRLKQESVITVK